VASISNSPEKLAREELCIKFANTVAWRLRDPVEERAASPHAMLEWLAGAGLANGQTVREVTTRWKQSPRDARVFLKEAVELREAIYSLFVAKIHARRADPAAAAILNAHLAGTVRGFGLTSSRTTLKWCSTSRNVAPEALLKPIAWSAAGLLMGPRAQKVRQCQDERGCGWLFIDESRTQNRRWCSMGDCGNLAKSRRHHRRVSANDAV
jgi:predicted RNA-binding Zn ribbon-like protein